tara:strand:- start:4525 stop:4758 length:234 start_codon:yes stop_codon:yes gene_type:complete
MIKYITIDTSEIGFVSFAELITDSIDTAIYSNDLQECLLRYEGDKPLSLFDVDSCSEPLSLDKVLKLLKTNKYKFIE